jgi:hypothetical protein
MEFDVTTWSNAQMHSLPFCLVDQTCGSLSDEVTHAKSPTLCHLS